MKHFTLSICFALIALNALGQSISKQVIGSSGEELSNDTYKVNFTVGETIVGMIENGEVIHQGFWAGISEDNTLTVETLVDAEEELSIYPNPVINVLQIKFKLQEVQNYTTQLYDLNGKQIFNLKPIVQGQIVQMDISHLSGGMYLLMVTDKTSNYNKSFKILKK